MLLVIERIDLQALTISFFILAHRTAKTVRFLNP